MKEQREMAETNPSTPVCEDSKYRRLKDLLETMDSVLIAFSGGVDSALLLSVAVEALGDRALAVTFNDPVFPSREVASARLQAAAMGARHRELSAGILAVSEFRENHFERCRVCKHHLFSMLRTLATQMGIAVLLHGENADDALDDRPGAQAARALSFRAPLADVGLTKNEIRQLARNRGLGVWDKPATACLATRIPYGVCVTAERLSMVERAESALTSLGFKGCRVRHHETVARIEAPLGDLQRFLDVSIRQAVTDRLRAVGYRHVALDLEGYGRGRMNRGIVRLP